MADDGASFEDWRAIHDLLIALTHALDGADWETMKSLIADDVTWTSAAAGEHSGKEGWLETQQPARSTLVRAQHLLGSPLITVDADHATSKTYVHGVDVHKDHEDQITRIVGTYHDEFERKDGGWIVKRRRFERVWVDPR